MPTATILLTENALVPAPSGAGPSGVAMRPAAVVVEGSRITRVVTAPGRRAALALLGPTHDAVIDDLGEAWLTPALIDGHTHLSLHSVRGLAEKHTTETNMVEGLYYRYESGLTAPEVRSFARMGAYEALIHGTGLVFDHYFHALEIAGAAVDVGLAAAVAPTVQDIGGPFQHASDEGLAAAETLDSPEWADRGIVAMIGPHAMDTVSPALWRKVADLAARRALPVHVHVAQSLEEVERVAARSGRSPVAELVHTGVLEAAPITLAVHMVYASRADLASLPKDRVILSHCPQSALVFGHPSRVDAWEAAGLRWLVASDTAASNDALDPRSELRLVLGQAALAGTFSSDYEAFLQHGRAADARAAWLRRGEARTTLHRLFDPAELLGAVTSVPGSAHPRLLAGVIAPGALANLALWDKDHPVFWPALDPVRSLAFADASLALRHMMTVGRWRGERGRFAESLRESDDYREHHAEASGRLRARLASLGM
jgi:5-methylthioadenosine/S-adenosylhomocysteine deaminase